MIRHLLPVRYSYLRTSTVGWFALRQLVVPGVRDRQSDPLAIGPFQQDLLHPRVRGMQRDIGIAYPCQNVDRSGMVSLYHVPSGKVKPIPSPDSEQPGPGINL